MEKNILREQRERKQQKEEIALKLVQLIKEQNTNVDIAIKSLERARDIIFLSTNV